MKFGAAEGEFVPIDGGRIDLDGFRGRHSEPGGLHVHHALQGLVVPIHMDRRAGGLLELLRAADVIDMRVGDHDGFDGEAVPGEDFEDERDFVAGIDHDSFARGFVAENGAVAGQHADGQNFVNHRPIVYSMTMYEPLTIAMRWLHITSMATLVGGMIFGRLAMSTALREVSPEARESIFDRAAQYYRPLVVTAICASILSGIYKF